MRHWFLPDVPDVVGLLSRQGDLTVEGVDALSRWARGDSSQEAEIQAVERRADAARREVLTAVRRAFVTAVGPEDVFELAERLDAVLKAAKDLARESEVLGLPPDGAIADMVDLVDLGVRDLVQAFRELVRNPDRATELADAAIHRQRDVEHVYRGAMSALVEQREIREVVGYRELYRRCSRMGDAVEHVAHRVWYAVVKGA